MRRSWLMSAAVASLMSCCVARGSKVKTPRGNRNVEELEVGDEIVVVDPETLEEHVSIVTAIRRAQRECGRLHFGSRILTVTSAHPLFDPQAKQWAPAGDWLLGVRRELVGEHGAVRVTKADRFVGIEEVFDLSVAHDLHTFVADGVVVHNKPGPPPGSACYLKPSDMPDFYAGQACACGPSEASSEREGRVTCGDGTIAPTCDCSFDDDQFTTWWRTDQGSSDVALRDGTWWTRVTRDGSSAVLQTLPWSGEPLSTLPVLPGAANELLVIESGDGSGAILAREIVDAGSFIGVSAWLQTNDVFPRVLALTRDEQDLLSLGLDRDRVWLVTPDGRRWVAENAPTQTWVKHKWRLELASSTTFQFRAQIAAAGNGAPLMFRAEDTGVSLEDFYADGGTFSFGDAGAPTELQLGHRSATDGGTGMLRVTGVTLSVW